MNFRRPLLALIIVMALGAVIEGKLPNAFAALAPVARDLALLFPLAFRLDHVGEVRVDLQFEQKRCRLLREVGEVQVFVYAAADVSGQAHLKRLLRLFLHLPAALVALSDLYARRQNYVVAEPRMLPDVRERNGQRRLAVNQVTISGKQPRLVDEEAVLRPATDKAIALGGKHGPALADVQGVVARAQADQVFKHSVDHFFPLIIRP
jgi:hypothetical protein